jgi:hypothetical protein
LEIVISIAFFRVQKFQDIFLDCITDKKGEPVTEWRGINWDLEGDDSQTFSQPGIQKLFDWDLNFFNHIPKTPESTKLLRRIESNKKWQSRL